MPDEKRAAYHTFLGAHDAAVVMSALRRLALVPKPWLPTVPEILGALQQMAGPEQPSWSEAWRGIERALQIPEEEDALAWLASKYGALVADFVRVEGHRTLRLTPFYDPDYGGAKLALLQRRWEEFVERRGERQRDRHALAAAGGRALGPTRFDPARALGPTKPELERGSDR